VDVVVRPLGLKPPYYYGAILLLVIEMAELAMLVATYFYLRVNFDKWPPGDLTPPPLPLPTLAVLLLLAALIPTYLGDKAIKHNNQRGLLWSYVVGTILFGAFIVVQFIHLSQLSYSWDTNAYSSILWLLIGFHWLFTLGLVIEQCVFIALSSVRYFNGERNSGVEYNGLNSYFTIFTWVPVYFIIYVLPKLHIL